jgi:hypothetical protein
MPFAPERIERPRFTVQEDRHRSYLGRHSSCDTYCYAAGSTAIPEA